MCSEGCTIRKLNIMKDVPEDLKNVVHVRLILGALQQDPVPIFRNLKAMLSMQCSMSRVTDAALSPKLTLSLAWIEPGGFLQWQEVNLHAIIIAAAKTGLESSATEELLREVKNLGIGE